MKTKLITSFFIFLICLSASAADNPKKSTTWERWQHTLVSSTATNQPVDVDMVFTGPDGKTFTSHAFTDDNKTFTFRAAFPVSGIWSWKTTCSDASNTSLHNISGKVKVAKYKGDNPLYRHGDLKVSDNKRYLVHADGTPFLWIGETGWCSTRKTSMEEFKYYVDVRLKQGFSVIQISPRGVGNRQLASESKNLSVTSEGKPDPLFWKDLEDKIAYANDRGIMILMVGIGNAWRDLFAENPQNQKFEEYFASRFASHMVIFSPSFDQLYIEDLVKVATGLQKYTSHLVTQHPGTNYEANISYGKTSVDFSGEQSGHHGGNLPKVYNAARQWTLDLWNSSPVKPVIDIEGMYDGYGHNDAKNWREKDSRKCGWIAWMSGSKGFTYGCGDVPPKVPLGNGGIWRFNRDSSTYDYWKKAIEWKSAGQMTTMRDFFRTIDWWKLAPCHEMILNQAEDETRKMVVSGTPDMSLVVCYLPDNDKIVLNLNKLSGNYNILWLNPETGDYLSAGPVTGGSSNQEFSRPEGWDDAVLKISKLQK